MATFYWAELFLLYRMGLLRPLLSGHLASYITVIFHGLAACEKEVLLRVLGQVGSFRHP